MSLYTTRPLSAEAVNRMTGKGTEMSPFKSSWTSTHQLLERELRQLGARNVVLMVDVSEGDLRLDGMMRASARPRSPRVALAFEARKRGNLMFCCGRFRTWEDNVRGIALGMESLRRVERYGIVQGDEQYRGWQAIGPAPSTEAAAWSVIANAAGLTVEHARHDPRTAHRLARKATHPDAGGSAEQFGAVEHAARTLGLVI